MLWLAQLPVTPNVGCLLLPSVPPHPHPEAQRRPKPGFKELWS